MKTIFVALIFVFDVTTGQPLGVQTAAFDEEQLCLQVVSQTVARASEDMTIYVEGGCVETPIITAAKQ